MQNILRIQWKTHKLYDLCNISAYKIVNSGYITAQDADVIRTAMIDAGFDMPFNVQSFMTPEQHERQQAIGYRARERAVKGSNTKQPVPVEKRMMDVAEKLHNMKKRLDVLDEKNDNKRIDICPLPGVDITYMVRKNRELVKAGYHIHIYSQCVDCGKNFEWDIMQLDTAPLSCSKCQKDSPSLFPAQSPDEGATIVTKVIMTKEGNDNTRFKYLGKDAGVGIERFGWVDYKPESLKVGFC